MMQKPMENYNNSQLQQKEEILENPAVATSEPVGTNPHSNDIPSLNLSDAAGDNGSGEKSARCADWIESFYCIAKPLKLLFVI